jgi:hypothetical protein
MTAHLQWQKRGVNVTHEVIVYQTKSKLEQGKMILTPDGENTGGTHSEGDKIRQEESTRHC